MSQGHVISGERPAAAPLRRNSLSEGAARRLLRQLEERKRELHAKIAAERDRIENEGLSQLEGAVGDDVDRAFLATHIGRERALIDRCWSQLNEIAAAHERFATGEIGTCVDCGEPIERGRLDVNPVASRCTECQERTERTARMA
jgi:RNA polymerase-binding transcription factor DksA